MLGGTTTRASQPAMCIAKGASVTLASIEHGEQHTSRASRARWRCRRAASRASSDQLAQVGEAACASGPS